MRAALAAALLLTAACSGGSTEPPTVSTVVVSPASGTLLLGPAGGQALQLTATPTAANGKALTARPVTWSSNALGVATVSINGLVVAIGTGTVTITATSDGKSGTAQLTVAPVPVATIAVAPTAPTTYVGGTLQLSADPRDSTGASLNGRPVTWSSSDTTVASVSAFGLLTAKKAGTTQVSAAAEGRTGTVTFTVTPPAGPVLTSVSPGTLVPGTVATVTGTGFEPAVSTLTLRGTIVPLLSATTTQVTFRVPCVLGGSAALRATSSGGPGPILTVPVATVTRTLAVGQSLVITDEAGSECNELSATGGTARYLIAAYSTATSQNTLIDLELGGNAAVAGLSAPDGAPFSSTRQGSSSAPAIARPVDVRRFVPRGEQAERDAAHFRHLERERALYQQLRAEGAFRTSKRATGEARLVAPPAIGDTRNLYYNFSGCSDSTKIIRGKVVFAGNRSIIWEDQDNALLSSASPELAQAYTRFGQVFDRDMFETVKTYFGDPLRRDAQTDDDGRIHMVFTQRLNGSGAAAYVTSCDMAARNTTTRAASNNGEFFYGTVPTTATPNVNSTASPDGWYAFMSRTVVHEVKHIASLSARIANGAPSFEQSWLEEGTARHAEEVWVRDSLHRVAWKANTGYGTAATNGVYCDFHLDDATCLAADPFRRPTWGMRRQLREILPKLLDPANWSPYGDGTGQSGAVFYNTVWSLVRWSADRYGTTDAGFLTALTQSTTSGLTNLAAVTGASPEHIIGAWGLALMADDYPGVASLSIDARFPTWNLRSIYAGLNADPAWSSQITSPYPVTTVPVGFGAFTVQRTGVRGGAHLFVELSGSHTSAQLLHLRGAGGAAMPTAARLAIVRVQ